MTTFEFLLESLKVIASMVVPFIAYLGLRTRADLDKFAASQRAEKNGTTVEEEMRKRWIRLPSRPKKP